MIQIGDAEYRIYHKSEIVQLKIKSSKWLQKIENGVNDPDDLDSEPSRFIKPPFEEVERIEEQQKKDKMKVNDDLSSVRIDDDDEKESVSSSEDDSPSRAVSYNKLAK